MVIAIQLEIAVNALMIVIAMMELYVQLIVAAVGYVFIHQTILLAMTISIVPLILAAMELAFIHQIALYAMIIIIVQVMYAL
jgi:hypothetical protein